MSCVRPALISETPPTHRDISLGIVYHWIAELRLIPYGFTREWKTPAETKSRAPADYKIKGNCALPIDAITWCATYLRLIIKKNTVTSRSTHALLEWENEGGTYVLDPTLNWRAYRICDFGGGYSHIPFYAFEGSRKYRGGSDDPCRKKLG